MTEMDQTKRYSAEEALRHPWISRIPTDIPNTIFQNIQNTHAAENLKATMRCLIFLSKLKGREKKVPEEYSKQVK